MDERFITTPSVMEVQNGKKTVFKDEYTFFMTREQLLDHLNGRKAPKGYYNPNRHVGHHPAVHALIEKKGKHEKK